MTGILSFGRAPRNYVAEGDSITDQGTAPGNGYANAVSFLASPKVDIFHNNAVSGSSIATMQSRAAAADALYISGSSQNILSVFIGANDLGGETTSFFLSNLASYLDARRATGWYVILCTVLPNSTVGSTFENNRAIVNPELRLWTSNGSIVPGKHCDRIADFAADPVMGPTGANLNATYYTTPHPTMLGQARRRDIFWPVFDASLTGYSLPPAIRLSTYTTEVGSTDLDLNLRADRGVTWSISGDAAITMNELSQLQLSSSTLGSYVTTITATDGNGLTTSQTFTWGVPNPPTGYGPNLLINGSGTNDLVGWSASAGSLTLGLAQSVNLSTFAIGAGLREFRIGGDGVTNNPQAGQDPTGINGKTYKVDWTMRAGTASSAQLNLQQANFSTANTTNTNFSQSYVSNSTVLPNLMVIPGTPTGDAYFSNIAIRQLLP